MMVPGKLYKIADDLCTIESGAEAEYFVKMVEWRLWVEREMDRCEERLQNGC